MSDERLVAEVKRRPDLYNKGRSGYRIHERKQAQWQALSSALGVPG